MKSFAAPFDENQPKYFCFVFFYHGFFQCAKYSKIFWCIFDDSDLIHFFPPILFDFGQKINQSKFNFWKFFFLWKKLAASFRSSRSKFVKIKRSQTNGRHFEEAKKINWTSLGPDWKKNILALTRKYRYSLTPKSFEFQVISDSNSHLSKLLLSYLGKNLYLRSTTYFSCCQQNLSLKFSLVVFCC